MKEIIYFTKYISTMCEWMDFLFHFDDNRAEMCRAKPHGYGFTSQFVLFIRRCNQRLVGFVWTGKCFIQSHLEIHHGSLFFDIIICRIRIVLYDGKSIRTINSKAETKSNFWNRNLGEVRKRNSIYERSHIVRGQIQFYIEQLFRKLIEISTTLNLKTLIGVTSLVLLEPWE